MISGEHAVLHGAHALVGAVDSRVTVSLTPRPDRRVRFVSALGTRETELDNPDISPPFQFAALAVKQIAPICPSGCLLDISAAMPPDVGLGSSAAVTVAVLGALHAWIWDRLPPPEQLHREALAIVRSIQGTASGADLAASIWGGVLLYRQETAVLQRHTCFPPVSLVYAGYKTPTTDVIRDVEARRRQTPGRFHDLYEHMDACSIKANDAFLKGDWQQMAEALKDGQQIMEAMGVCDKTLTDIMQHLDRIPGILAAKISGSGLGDSVLTLGPLPADALPYRQISIHFSEQGLKQVLGKC